MGHDTSLIQRCLRRDALAYQQLVALYDDAITRTAFAILGNLQDAQDAAQETWLRVFHHLHTFQDGSDFEAWLFTIAAREAHRRARRRFGWLPLLHAERMTAPSSERESGLDTMACLRQLPANQSTALILRYYHDLTVPQIARTMGRPEGTVKSWLSRGLSTLRDTMRADETVDPPTMEGVHHGS